MQGIDAVRLSFDPTSLLVLNAILAAIMFGIALELRVDDFRRVLTQPRSVAVGLIGQLLLLPAMTFLMTLLLDLPGTVELGMLLVAACPGGNVSNFLSAYAGGNASLSITMTSVATLGCIVSTPVNVALWGSLNPATADVLREVSIDPLRMALIVALIIGHPVVLGMTLRARRPGWADRLVRPFKVGSIAALILFVGVALWKNVPRSAQYLPMVIAVVASHNAVALATGRGLSSLARLSEPDRRSITLEVGVQNCGLALVLIFTFFEGVGGMALTAAIWGMWHTISGLPLAHAWSLRPTSPARGDISTTG